MVCEDLECGRGDEEGLWGGGKGGRLRCVYTSLLFCSLDEGYELGCGEKDIDFKNKFIYPQSYRKKVRLIRCRTLFANTGVFLYFFFYVFGKSILKGGSKRRQKEELKKCSRQLDFAISERARKNIPRKSNFLPKERFDFFDFSPEVTDWASCWINGKPPFLRKSTLHGFVFLSLFRR